MLDWNVRIPSWTGSPKYLQMTDRGMLYAATATGQVDSARYVLSRPEEHPIKLAVPEADRRPNGPDSVSVWRIDILNPRDPSEVWVRGIAAGIGVAGDLSLGAGSSGMYWQLASSSRGARPHVVSEREPGYVWLGATNRRPRSYIRPDAAR